ncbi:hypothetical protein MPSEU_000058900 [Mayamaea pseudoterrestris]|nr:hypothetical protein MPSEU_000058900 [Mayamaea pseudoterrestris]
MQNSDKSKAPFGGTGNESSGDGQAAQDQVFWSSSLQCTDMRSRSVLIYKKSICPFAPRPTKNASTLFIDCFKLQKKKAKTEVMCGNSHSPLSNKSLCRYVEKMAAPKPSTVNAPESGDKLFCHHHQSTSRNGTQIMNQKGNHLPKIWTKGDFAVEDAVFEDKKYAPGYVQCIGCQRMVCSLCWKRILAVMRSYPALAKLMENHPETAAMDSFILHTPCQGNPGMTVVKFTKVDSLCCMSCEHKEVLKLLPDNSQVKKIRLKLVCGPNTL